MRAKQKIIAIVGPTASGKSDLAVMLAKKFGGEIISADSRQIYKGLNIATGKVSGRYKVRGLRGKKQFVYKSIPHHCIDTANPKKQYSVTEFQACAEDAIADITLRGKLPIIAGGTGFWIDSVVDGQVLPDVPPNKRLRKYLEKKSPQALFTLLKKLDPVRARFIDPHNPRRLVRAIEIARALGKVPQIKKETRYNTLLLGISLPKEKLKANIHKRLLSRIKQGMIQEARNLHTHGLSYKRMYELGLEYRYLADLLQKKTDKKEFAQELEKEINNYAKRQMTWFRKNKNIRWIEDVRDGEMLVECFPSKLSKIKWGAKS